MKSEYIEKDKLLKINITEEIDHHMVEELRRKLDHEIERCMPRKIVFDFSGVPFMDSAGIGMLIGRYKHAKQWGANSYMQNVSPSIRKIFEMCGILKIIPIVENQ